MASLLLAFAQTQFAVGDTFRRLASKLLMDSVVARVTAHLRPEQIGVQVSNAAETTARKVRLWTQDAKPNEILLQVDMRNAFGTVDRNRMLSEVRAYCPCLFPCAWNVVSLANIEALGSVEPEDIDAAWLK